jgi:hypothetical protein
VSSDNAKQRGGQPVSLATLLTLAAILAAGVFLRGQAFLATEVVEPLQADAADAYALAQALSSQGAYNILAAPFSGGGEAASGETFSSLGYPLFLSLFAEPEATTGGLNAIVITQMVLSALAILLVFMLTTRLLDPYWGLTAALLTAVSPFLVNISLYLVGATVLMIALLLYLVTAAKISERGGLIRTFIASALLGLAALTDPTFEFLILPWVVMLLLSTKGVWKLMTPLAAVIGFGLVFSPLVVQNQNAVDAPVATAPIAESIQQGLPPAAAGDEASSSEGTTGEARLGSAFGQLGQGFIEDPSGFLRWYFFDKTQTLWSWGEPNAAEQSFVYPVSETPYAENPSFLASEEFMSILHGPVVLIGALGAVLVWLPFAGRRLNPAQRIGLRSVSLVLLYATIAHGFGVAAPQYATPLLPMLFVMALTPLYLVTLPRREDTKDKVQEKAKQEESTEESSEESSEEQPAAA